MNRDSRPRHPQWNLDRPSRAMRHFVETGQTSWTRKGGGKGADGGRDGDDSGAEENDLHDEIYNKSVRANGRRIGRCDSKQGEGAEEDNSQGEEEEEENHNDYRDRSEDDNDDDDDQDPDWDKGGEENGRFQPPPSKLLLNIPTAGAPEEELPSAVAESSTRVKQKITISDDRSLGSEYEATRRDLVALKPRENKGRDAFLPDSRNTCPTSASPEGAANSGSYALSDYQVQLRILEQQNADRLRKALLEQAWTDFTLSAESQNTVSGIVAIPEMVGEIGVLEKHSSRSNSLLMNSHNQPGTSQDRQEAEDVLNEQTSRKGSSSGKTTKHMDYVPQTLESHLPSMSKSQKKNAMKNAAKKVSQLSQLDTLSRIVAHDVGLPEPSAVGFEYLKAYIVGLQEKADTLETLSRKLEPSKFRVIHRIIHGKQVLLYLDAPQWTIGENGSRAFKSSLPISSGSSYLDRHPELAFIVYRDYDVTALKDAGSTDEEEGIMPRITHTGESLYAASKGLVAAVNAFLMDNEPFADVVSDFHQSQMLLAPYLVVYHSRKILPTFLSSLPDQQYRQFKILLNYILREYQKDYSTVDSLVARGKITHAYIKYIFKPGDILVEGSKHKFRGVFSKSWLMDRPDPVYYSSWRGRPIKKDQKVKCWEVHAVSWKFSGIFSRYSCKLTLELDVSDPSELDIVDLNLRPLAYVSGEMKDVLKRRGETCWKCRIRHFVSYNEDKGPEAHHSGDDRYMIDLRTYHELHKSQGKKVHSVDEGLTDDLGEAAMMSDTPPDAAFVYLVPPTIKGYNLKKKQWLELQVDKISEVVWNKEAFQSLVLDRKTKGLIEALISNHLDATKSTDLISGKGNGLILLLHGSPGTGKTLTAESVAEIAEKPLYPVTCGDIGTRPEEVEQYLESVLSLGKKWGCVVLLDEADVFLEQRSLEDLRRNALVSVFLRVLEYYDGILVLTSNRVGTFDEAFKSRIQLALHYANLSEFQRVIIWRNFIERLERLEEEMVDFDDLKDNLEQLAKNKMNGRQIRNAITTARQYVKWKGESLNYAILSDIIKTAGRFDLYIEKLNGGYSQDQLAEDEGLRLSEARAREV